MPSNYKQTRKRTKFLKADSFPLFEITLLQATSCKKQTYRNILCVCEIFHFFLSFSNYYFEHTHAVLSKTEMKIEFNREHRSMGTCC